MPTVSVEIGLSLPIPGIDFGHVKPLIRVDGIDTEGDVDRQIQVALETAAKATVAVDEQLEVAIGQIIAQETGAPSYRDRMELLEEQLAKTRRQLKRVVDAVAGTEVASEISEAVTSG